MTIVYREDDPISGRWTGLGRLLTKYEGDFNSYQFHTRIATLEANYTLTISLASVTQPTPSTLLFHKTDASTDGPFTLPVAVLRSRGAWAVSTPYLVNDTFSANGAFYRVLFDHTSSPTSFSPTANDGAGHDYYEEMIPPLGNALPAGGATGMVLQKSSGGDYAVMWGYKLPTGGTAGQVLLKQSSTNQAAAWTTLSASLVTFTPATGSAIISTNVADAIEEVSQNASTVSALADLSDVLFATGDPHAGQLLQFNGTKWTAVAAGASTGDVLKFNGTDWVPESLDFTSIGGSLTLGQLRYGSSPTGLGGGVTGAFTVDPTLNNVFETDLAGAANLSATSTPAGAEITLIVTAIGASPYVLTFNSGTFKSQGTLSTGSVNGKTFAIRFVSNGSYFFEVSRTTAM